MSVSASVCQTTVGKRKTTLFGKRLKIFLLKKWMVPACRPKVIHYNIKSSCQSYQKAFKALWIKCGVVKVAKIDIYGLASVQGAPQIFGNWRQTALTLSSPIACRMAEPLNLTAINMLVDDDHHCWQMCHHHHRGIVSTFRKPN